MTTNSKEVGAGLNLGISTRERILRVTAALFAKRGFSAVGMTEIGDAVGLGRGALYYHIDSKETLLYDIMTTYMSKLLTGGRAILSAKDNAPEIQLRVISRHLMRTIADHQPELTVCFREVHALTGARHGEVLDLHAAYQALWSDILSDGVRRGAFRPVSNVVLKGLLGMYFYSFLWLRPNGSQTPEAIGDAFADVVLCTVRVTPTASSGGPDPAPAARRPTTRAGKRSRT